MFCHNCERLVPKGSQVCPYCGAELDLVDPDLLEEDGAVPARAPEDFGGLTWGGPDGNGNAAPTAGRIHHVVATNDFLNPPDEEYDDYEPEPFYRRWWFWALIGVCAAVILVSVLILTLGRRTAPIQAEAAAVPAVTAEAAPAPTETPAPEDEDGERLFAGLDAYTPAAGETDGEAAAALESFLSGTGLGYEIVSDGDGQTDVYLWQDGAQVAALRAFDGDAGAIADWQDVLAALRAFQERAQTAFGSERVLVRLRNDADPDMVLSIVADGQVLYDAATGVDLLDLTADAGDT